jgi:RTX calcium-binding nonapeptide repeat (4 copies)
LVLARGIPLFCGMIVAYRQATSKNEREVSMRKLMLILTVAAMMVALSAGAALALNLTGDNGPDRLVGTAENDTLRGLGGRDTLIGRGDSDRLFGGSGNDFINATDPRPEDDLVNCGAGFDRALVDPSTEDRVMSNCERVVVR